MKYFTLLISTTILLFTSCKKDDSDNTLSGTGSVELEFDNVVGTQDLQLNTGNYTNAVGESYKISSFIYYISNIKLKTTTGQLFTVPQDSSYFLIKETGANQKITLRNVPAGDYSQVSFVLGVDSLRSAAPLAQRTGALDPAGEGAEMYWTWNSGYIFLKMEGTSPAVAMPDKKFYYHIGGFGGYSSKTINNIKAIELSTPAGMVAKVRKETEAPEVHLFADAGKVLNGSTNVSIAANSMVMFADYSVNIANNYQSMFKIDHVHNH